MTGREVGVERDEHLDGARVAGVVDDQLAKGEGEREEAGCGEAGHQDCVPEHLAVWQGGRRQPEDEEGDGEGMGRRMMRWWMMMMRRRRS